MYEKKNIVNKLRDIVRLSFKSISSFKSDKIINKGYGMRRHKSKKKKMLRMNPKKERKKISYL